jgi:hypothetical protein
VCRHELGLDLFVFGNSAVSFPRQFMSLVAEEPNLRLLHMGHIYSGKMCCTVAWFVLHNLYCKDMEETEVTYSVLTLYTVRY